MLHGYKQHINQALEQFFAEVPGLLGLDLSDRAQEAIDLLGQYTLRPGKRIRGSLAAAAYDQSVGLQYSAAGLQLGVALELVQSYLLVIDDVMDKSQLRRGEPTLHRMYVARHGGGSRLIHEANMLAVNVGLIAQHFANLALLRSGETPGHIMHAQQLMHKNIVATGFGQIDDLHQQFVSGATMQDIIRKHCQKSSYYTFINPLQCGLALAGKDTQKKLQAIKEFGEPAGIAFQLHDDTLGIFGDSAQSGKANTDDIEEGKYTLLVYYAFEHGNKEQRKILKELLGSPVVDRQTLTVVQDIFIDSGAKAFAEQQAQAYALAARHSLENSHVWDKEFTDVLIAVVDYVVQRQS